MSENSHNKHVNGKNRILRICTLFCAIWTLVIGTFCFFAIRNQNEIPLLMARTEATASYNKDVVYRRWSSLHGGTYVPVTESTKPNPYLTNLEERDVYTPSGRLLTLMNPAYMTRQVYEPAAVPGMEKILTRLGYKPTAVTISLEALKKFRENPELYDVLITDMTMPDMTGKKLAEEIRFIKPGIPVILCTGYSDQINEEDARKAGINEFMTKPVNMNDIAFVIRKVLESR